MNIKNRINKLEGFIKEALNFKTFKKIWPSVLDKSYDSEKEWIHSNNIDVRTAFELYKNVQLPKVIQEKLISYDIRYSLTNITPKNYVFPAGWRGREEGDVREYAERRIRESNERAAEIMLSGRHGSGQARSDRYVAPTRLIGYHPQSGAPLHGLGEEGGEIQTVDPKTGELPLLNKEEFSKPGTVWAPYMLVYKGSKGVVSRRYENPNEARWVTSHPDVATGYARSSRNTSDSILEVFDIRKIPKEKRSLFSRHIMTDSRGMSPDEIMNYKADENLWGSSPFYEMVVSDEEMHKARIAKYKALPGVGWMLVEGRNILKDGLSPDEAEEHRKIFEEEAKNLLTTHPQMYFYYGINGTQAGITPEMEIAALDSILENNPMQFMEKKLYSNIKSKANKEYVARILPQKLKEFFKKLADKDVKYFIRYESTFYNIVKSIEYKNSNKYIINIKRDLFKAYDDILNLVSKGSLGGNRTPPVADTPPPVADTPPPTANIPPPPTANIPTDSMSDIAEESYLKNRLTKLSRALELMGLRKEAWAIIKLADKKVTFKKFANPEFLKEDTLYTEDDFDEEEYEVYHGSPNDFKIFDSEKSREFGFHFGTMESASHRGSRDGSVIYLKKFKIKIKNPLRFRNWDSGRWSPESILEGIFRGKSNISKEKEKRLFEIINNFEVEARNRSKKMYTSLSYEKNELFKNILEDLGYDGIIYENRGESGGEAYIVFRPSNIEFIGSD